MTPCKAILLALGTLLAALPLAAEAMETYTVDPRHTFTNYEAKHLGFSTQRGRFNRTRGRIGLDLAARRGWVHIEVDPDSVDSGDAQLDAVLRTETFFDTEVHPYVYFRSTGMEFDGDRPARVPGELVMRGVTRPIVLTIQSFHCGPNPVNKRHACGADVTTTLKRSEFGMTRYLSWVSDEVRLLISVEAFRDE